MAREYATVADLGPSYTGLTLKVVLRDETGATVNFADSAASKIDDDSTLQVVEYDSGFYSVWTNQIPDSVPAFIALLDNADDSFLGQEALVVLNDPSAATIATAVEDTLADDFAGITASVDEGALSAAVWAVAPAAVVAAVSSSGAVSVYRGTTWNVPLTGLPDMSDYDTVYLTIKRRLEDEDEDAIMQLSTDGGLLILNGATAATAANGTLTKNGTTGLDAWVEESETATVAPWTYYYDVKGVDADGDTAMLAHPALLWSVVADVTRKVS